MSADLPDQLRAQVDWDELGPDQWNMTRDERLFAEAADEIDRLREQSQMRYDEARYWRKRALENNDD